MAFCLPTHFTIVISLLIHYCLVIFNLKLFVSISIWNDYRIDYKGCCEAVRSMKPVTSHFTRHGMGSGLDLTFCRIFHTGAVRRWLAKFAILNQLVSTQVDEQRDNSWEFQRFLLDFFWTIVIASEGHVMSSPFVDVPEREQNRTELAEDVFPVALENRRCGGRWDGLKNILCDVGDSVVVILSYI